MRYSYKLIHFPFLSKETTEFLQNCPRYLVNTFRKSDHRCTMELTYTEYLAEKYVVELYARLASTYLAYHNLSHTERVVAHTLEIADYYQLEDTDRFVLSIAAWFHDTGHLVADIELH